jgi:hypothetical protein
MMRSLLRRTTATSAPDWRRFVLGQTRTLITQPFEENSQSTRFLKRLQELDRKGFGEKLLLTVQASRMYEQLVQKQTIRGVPFVLRTQAKDMVDEHARLTTESGDRQALLCNTGVKGSGKTSQQFLNMVHMAMDWECMCVEVEFNGRQQNFTGTFFGRVPSFEDHLVSRILRHLPFFKNKRTFSALEVFLTENKTDGMDPDQVTARHAMVLVKRLTGHNGPMFLSIDEFSCATGRNKTKVALLRDLCGRFLQATILCPDMRKDERIYLGVSVYDAIDLSKLATTSSRPLLLQLLTPVFPMLSPTSAQLKALPKWARQVVDPELRSDPGIDVVAATEVSKLFLLSGGHPRRVEVLLQQDKDATLQTIADSRHEIEALMDKQLNDTGQAQFLAKSSPDEHHHVELIRATMQPFASGYDHVALEATEKGFQIAPCRIPQRVRPDALIGYLAPPFFRAYTRELFTKFPENKQIANAALLGDMMMLCHPQRSKTTGKLFESAALVAIATWLSFNQHPRGVFRFPPDCLYEEVFKLKPATGVDFDIPSPTIEDVFTAGNVTSTEGTKARLTKLKQGTPPTYFPVVVDVKGNKISLAPDCKVTLDKLFEVGTKGHDNVYCVQPSSDSNEGGTGFIAAPLIDGGRLLIVLQAKDWFDKDSPTFDSKIHHALEEARYYRQFFCDDEVLMQRALTTKCPNPLAAKLEEYKRKVVGRTIIVYATMTTNSVEPSTLPPSLGEQFMNAKKEKKPVPNANNLYPDEGLIDVEWLQQHAPTLGHGLFASRALSGIM